MLSERDRRVLARIEAHFVETDPDLVRLFREGPRGAGGNALPRTLLVFGLVMIVLGCVVTAVPVALFGVMLTFASLWVASVAPKGFGRPQLA